MAATVTIPVATLRAIIDSAAFNKWQVGTGTTVFTKTQPQVIEVAVSGFGEMDMSPTPIDKGVDINGFPISAWTATNGSDPVPPSVFDWTETVVRNSNDADIAIRWVDTAVTVQPMSALAIELRLSCAQTA
jgi:hypothetical protein